MAIINNPSIHAIIVMRVLNVTVGNQIRASDVDWRIISLQILDKKVHCNTEKPQLVRTDKRKYIRHRETVKMKASNKRYTCL